MVTIYTRNGCSLCEKAVNILVSMQEELDFEIEIVDITTNSQLEHMYTDQIPVIHIDGQHHDYWRVDPEKFRTALLEHRRNR
jgi:glutaredoxin